MSFNGRFWTFDSIPTHSGLSIYSRLSKKKRPKVVWALLGPLRNMAGSIIIRMTECNLQCP